VPDDTPLAPKAVMMAVAGRGEEFEFKHYCGGPNSDRSL
jgi:hypothetical protein